jgi:hypothetical protein
MPLLTLCGFLAASIATSAMLIIPAASRTAPEGNIVRPL